ncbi:hypothetical protein ACJJTC_004535 [Scirpophaga incertulas]
MLKWKAILRAVKKFVGISSWCTLGLGFSMVWVWRGPAVRGKLDIPCTFYEASKVRPASPPPLRGRGGGGLSSANTPPPSTGQVMSPKERIRVLRIDWSESGGQA